MCSIKTIPPGFGVDEVTGAGVRDGVINDLTAARNPVPFFVFDAIELINEGNLLLIVFESVVVDDLFVFRFSVGDIRVGKFGRCST